MEYKFDCIFDITNDVIIDIDIEYLKIGISYLGYIIKTIIYKDLDLKYKIDIENIINLLITEFNRILKIDEEFKFIKLNYDVVYKELEIIIKDKINQYSDLIEEI